MIELTPKPGIELLVVEVPEDANNFDVSNEHHVFSWQYPVQYRPNEIDAESLPPGNYSFIATSRDITEEQARGFFDEEDLALYYDNHHTPGKAMLFYQINLKGGDTYKKNYAILKLL